MPKPIVVSKHINASPAEVFNLVADIPNAADRIDDITKVEMLTDPAQPVGVGTKFRETRKMFGKEATEEMEFVEFVPNDHYTLHANSCGCLYISTISVEQADGGGTNLIMTFEATPLTTMAKLMMPMSFLMKGVMVKCIDRDLQCIKNHAEGNDSTNTEAATA